MQDDEQERIETGRFIAFLRWFRGIENQSELARVTGVPRSDINRYEKGRLKPQAATFEKIRSRLGLTPRLARFLRWCHRMILHAEAQADRLEATPPSETRLPDEDRAAAVDILERALAMARAEHALLRGEAEKTTPPRHG